VTGNRINYTFEGYDPDDGLDEDRGRWMYDDERICQVWVETVAPARRRAAA
jgi:hypothetical protein